jgi:hypothetical protein
MQADWSNEVLRRHGSDTAFVFFESVRYAPARTVRFPLVRHRNFCSLENRLLAPGTDFGSNDSTEFNPDRDYDSRAYAAIAGQTLRFLDATLKSKPTAGAAGELAPASDISKRAWPNPIVLLRRLTTESPADIVSAAARLRDSLPGYTDLDEQPLNDRALQWLRARELENAGAATTVMLALYPASATAAQDAGLVRRDMKDSVGAVRLFQRALALDSTRTYLKQWIERYQPHPPARQLRPRMIRER